MRKTLAALSIILLFNGTAEAFPWKKVIKGVVIWGAPVATSLLATKGGVDCRRRNGVEPCTAHYGDFRTTEIARGGLSFTMSATTFGCLRETSWRGCWGPVIGMSASNLYWWRHEESIRETVVAEK